MDRGYLDFARLNALLQAGSFFVIRARSNFQCRLLYSRPVDRRTGLICDQLIELVVFYPNKAIPIGCAAFATATTKARPWSF